VDATPYKRDVLKELSQACKRHNLKFGIYFSLIDWHFPQASPISSHNSDYITPEHHTFNKNQVTELLTNYGEISELWFDMGSMSIEQSKEMNILVHTLQPNCVIGSRIGNDMGDFTVMGDNQEPDYTIGVPWQSPASFFDETWGYRSWQKRTDADEKMKEKLTSLVRVISRGGNYLLNIGPRGDGSIVEYEKDILLNIGTWINKNSEAVYDTHPDPFHTSFGWGNVTSKGNKLYLHLLQIPDNRIIVLPGITGNVAKAFVLENKLACSFKRSAGNLEIRLPASVSPFQVIAVEFTKPYSVSPPNLIEFRSDGLLLGNKNSFRSYSNSGIDYNTRYTSTIKCLWNVISETKTRPSAKLVYTEEEKGTAIDLTLNGKITNIHLDGDNRLEITNELASLKFGPMSIQGSYWAAIDGVETNQQVVPHPEWKRGTNYSLPAGLNTAYNLLQEIESPIDQQVIVKVTSGDGLLVMLNDKQRYIQNNPTKKETVDHVLVLDLTKGKNQLLIKLFNHFQKRIDFALDFNVAQVVYVKQLAPIDLPSKAPVEISWRESNPVTPHKDMNTPNLLLVLGSSSPLKYK
jgi:alpha-L-fucosidase